MPLGELTQRQAERVTFRPLGRIHKGTRTPIIDEKTGEQKEKSGQPLWDMQNEAYWVLTTADENVAQKWREVYGEEPQSIRIMLPWKTPDEVFGNLSWREEWDSHGLVHRCDGTHIQRRRKKNTFLYESWKMGDPEAPKCPYVHLEDDAEKGCVMKGRVAVMLPDLIDTQAFGFFILETGSINDVAGVRDALYEAYDIATSLGRPNGFQGAEFICTREWRIISKRWASGHKREHDWMITMHVASDWLKAQAREMRALSQGRPVQAALPGPVQAFSAPLELDDLPEDMVHAPQAGTVVDVEAEDIEPTEEAEPTETTPPEEPPTEPASVITEDMTPIQMARAIRKAAGWVIAEMKWQRPEGARRLGEKNKKAQRIAAILSKALPVDDPAPRHALLGWLFQLDSGSASDLIHAEADVILEIWEDTPFNLKENATDQIINLYELALEMAQ